jgi:hypothetical protein
VRRSILLTPLTGPAQRDRHGGHVHARRALGVLAVAVPVQAVWLEQQADAVLGHVGNASNDLDRRARVEGHPRRELAPTGQYVAGERQVVEESVASGGEPSAVFDAAVGFLPESRG